MGHDLLTVLALNGYTYGPCPSAHENWYRHKGNRA